MFITKKLIQAVSQDPDLLEKFVALFNEVQDKQDDVDGIVYDFYYDYNSYRNKDYEYKKMVGILDKAEKLYNDFLLELKEKYGDLNDK